MTSTEKSTNPASTRYAAWIGPIWADIRLGQRRQIEFNRILRRPAKNR